MKTNRIDDSQVLRKVASRKPYSLDFDVATLECGHVILTGHRRAQEPCCWCRFKSPKFAGLKLKDQILGSNRVIEKESEGKHELAHFQKTRELPPQPPASLPLV